VLYKIKAKYHKDLLRDFFRKLTDGTIENQKPDGLEMIASMKKAKIVEDNSVEWYERCFCEIPLNHERTTVYDTYFYEFEPMLVHEVSDDIMGDSFWEYMENI